MKSIFPQPILDLSEINVSFDGVKGYVVQGEKEQVVFIEFENDVIVPEHSHESQWEIVLEGKVDYFKVGIKHTYNKGDRFFVQKGKNIQQKSMQVIAALCFLIRKTGMRKNR